jgi:hypothetical protein
MGGRATRVVLAASLSLAAAPPATYSEVAVDSAWAEAVWADPFLRDGGPSVLEGPGGRTVVAATGSAPLAAGATASARMTARRIAESNAKAALARFAGSTVETTSTLETERVTVTTTDADAAQQRVSSARRVFRSMTIERAQQALKGARVLGSWSVDGALFLVVSVELPSE